MKAIVYLIITFVSFGDIHSQSTNPPYIDFRIDNTETVNKIIISDNTGEQFELHRKGNKWTDKYDDCISQNNVEHILDAFKNIEFKAYLPDSEIHHYKNREAIAKIKVEIFQNDVNTKTWYFGPPTTDHYGQIMYLKLKGENDNSIPAVMKLKNLNGIFESRFFTDAKQWRCTNIYSVPAEEIAHIVIVNNENPEKSFRIEKYHEEILIYNRDKLLTNFDTTMLHFYLKNFKDVNYHSPNYLLNNDQIDSLKRTIPFIEPTVTTRTGFSKTIKCYKKINSKHEDGYDTDLFWCILPSIEELVICQYFVFNRLFLGQMYFPFDSIEGE